MKKMLTALAVLAVLLLPFPSLSGAVPPEGPGADAERVETTDGITFLMTYGAKGTRSESRHHYLEIGGFPVPDVFSRLKYKTYSFAFASRKHLWGDDGYVQTGDLAVPDSASPLPEELLKRGWYEGTGRLAGTPEDWVWGAWGDGSLFASPEKLAEAAKELKLHRLPREGSPLFEALRPIPGKEASGDAGEGQGLPEETVKDLEETLKKQKGKK